MSGGRSGLATLAPMSFTVRIMRSDEHAAVAELICSSMNTWDILHGSPGRFAGGPAQTALFPQVYEALDPGNCLVAEATNGALAGSCFYRERETHVALGIMNVAANYFGKGVAKQLLADVIDVQEASGKPLRLVSSVMNLESYSLYTRAGFVPRQLYQDLVLQVPTDGIHDEIQGADRIRAATTDDIEAIAELELELSGIARRRDYRYFIENADSHWLTKVIEGKGGRLDGYLVSIAHPLFHEIGPGVARVEEQAAALLVDHLNEHRGEWVLFLVPAECAALVARAYRWGARNCEMHAAQVRGPSERFRGVSFPTFLPETG